MIYHICRKSEWEPSQETGFYKPANFEKEGFIHFSTVTQISESAQKFFAGNSELILLEVDEKENQQFIKFENLMGGNNLYPHFYSTLPLQAVKRVIPFPIDNTGSFPIPEAIL